MGLYICAVALDILQFETTSLCFIFKFGGKARSFVSEGLKACKICQTFCL